MFKTDLVVKELERPGWWKLEQALEYCGRDQLFSVPIGFETNFTSVPRIFMWLVPRSGRYTKASVLHDYLSREWVPADKISRCDADGLFRRSMRELGVSALRRWLMWMAVRFRKPTKIGDCGWRPMLTALALLLFVSPIALSVGLLLFAVLTFAWAIDWVLYRALPSLKVRPELIWWIE